MFRKKFFKEVRRAECDPFFNGGQEALGTILLVLGILHLVESIGEEHELVTCLDRASASWKVGCLEQSVPDLLSPGRLSRILFAFHGALSEMADHIWRVSMTPRPLSNSWTGC